MVIDGNGIEAFWLKVVRRDTGRRGFRSTVMVLRVCGFL